MLIFNLDRVFVLFWRTISKLESQVRQLQHETLVKTRQGLHGHSQPSGAGYLTSPHAHEWKRSHWFINVYIGVTHIVVLSSNLKHGLCVVRLFHHPDLLLSPSRRPRDECSVRNGAAQTSGSSSDQSARGYDTIRNITWSFTFYIICCLFCISVSRHLSPLEREQVHPEEQRKRDVPMTPMMKALIQMEDTKATECRALAKTNCSGSSTSSDVLHCFWPNLLSCVVIISSFRFVGFRVD